VCLVILQFSNEMVATYVVYIYTDKSVTKRLYTKLRCDRMYDT